MNFLVAEAEDGLWVTTRKGNWATDLATPTLCPVQPALPHSFIPRSRNKSARFL